MFESDTDASIAMSTCSLEHSMQRWLCTKVDDCGYVCINGNDDHGLGSIDTEGVCAANDQHSFFIFNALAFETYYIVVSGYDSLSPRNFQFTMVEFECDVRG